MKIPTFLQTKFALCTFSSLLFWLAWQLTPFFVLIAFVPLLWVENQLRRASTRYKTIKTWFWAYYTLWAFNLYTTGWIAWGIFYGAGIELVYGAAFAIFVNAWLMTFPFMFFSFFNRKAHNLLAYFSFVFFWTCFEYLHLNWDLSWSWLNLGNAFAYAPWAIQWYEYTGSLGGTFWIVLVNVLIFLWIYRKTPKYRNASLIAITLPLLVSLFIWFTYEEKGRNTEIVVVQPNIDPYTQKFVDTKHFIPFHEQAEIFIRLAKQKMTTKTQLVALPETAIDDYMEEKLIQSEVPFYPAIDKFKQFIKQNPEANLLTGITSFTRFNSPKEASPYVTYGNGLGWYEVYNTALFLAEGKMPAFYHKSKLVPGVEALPFPEFFKLFGDVMLKLGGTSGGVAKQKERTVFLGNNGIAYAPLICYESVFGDFTNEYVRKGANVLVIITNDAWWGNSSGHKQHFHYARLRAIETRRAVAQSANTGISGFIDQKGNILQQSKYWVQTALRATLKANTKNTFYTQFGDWVGIGASYFALLFILILIFLPKKQNKANY
ncbi:MAG: apolipoprotein N-acyltransferase [Microscillaceae bacterium]|nr:apolipoprotein N-acyltransferase [Microscillaceae bacterium]MDW8460636.1 apolipoprotein N-acyltransferase [Cytophagales bacterium]